MFYRSIGSPLRARGALICVCVEREREEVDVGYAEALIRSELRGHDGVNFEFGY